MKVFVALFSLMLVQQVSAATHTCTQSELSLVTHVPDQLGYKVTQPNGTAFVVISLDGIYNNQTIEEPLECEQTRQGLEISVADKFFGFVTINKKHSGRIRYVTLDQTKNELLLKFEDKNSPFKAINLKSFNLRLSDGRSINPF